MPVRDYILLQSQRVTLAPGVSKGGMYTHNVLSFVSKHTSAVDCNVILQNDMVKEEEEYFTVTLQTNDLGARLVTSKTTVFITDIGDGEHTCDTLRAFFVHIFMQFLKCPSHKQSTMLKSLFQTIL